MRHCARVFALLAVIIGAFRLGMLVQAAYPGRIDEWMITFFATLSLLLALVFFVAVLTKRERTE